MRDYIDIDRRQLDRLELVKAGYKKLYNCPDACRPMIIINTASQSNITWEQKLADPLVMLRSQLDNVRAHLEIGDDFLPAVRVDFGTGQIASAFGCDITVPENNLPAVCSHPIKRVEDINKIAAPPLTGGMYGKLFDWINIWKENIPDWLRIQHPDIQSPFNNAHLVRGNDILLDFYDDPAAVEYLLDVITDYTIAVVKNINAMIGADDGWFCDWGGAYWKGAARISNCSNDMISPRFYTEYVLPRDVRLLGSIGGGRVHYCGGHRQVIDEFFKNPEITGLDIDAGLHDLWSVAGNSPQKLVLVFQNYGKPFPQLERLLSGDWPRKRNIVLYTDVGTIEEGKDLLIRLRNSIPY